jgi:hypothetical protein
MNCEVVQRQLLSREDPDSPTAAASAHLADCAACREWLLRLVQIERAVIHLPVPPAEAARSALMRRILAQKAGTAPPAGPHRRPSVAMILGSWIMDPHSSPRRRVAAGLVAGVAAAMLLFVLGWLVWYGGNEPAPSPGPRVVDPLAQDLRRYKIEAGETANPRDRVGVMAKAAEELRGRAAALPAGAETDLIDLAQLYTRVVDEGIVKTAEGLSPEDRRTILASIAKDLGEADTHWQRLSQQTGLSKQASRALERAALSARNGKERLDGFAA